MHIDYNFPYTKYISFLGRFLHVPFEFPETNGITSNIPMLMYYFSSLLDTVEAKKPSEWSHFPSYDYTTEFVRSAAVFADFIVNMKAGHSVYILGVTQMPPFLWLYLWGTQISVTVAVSGSKPAVLVYQAGVGQEAVLPNVYFLLFSS